MSAPADCVTREISFNGILSVLHLYIAKGLKIAHLIQQEDGESDYVKGLKRNYSYLEEHERELAAGILAVIEGKANSDFDELADDYLTQTNLETALINYANRKLGAYEPPEDEDFWKRDEAGRDSIQGDDASKYEPKSQAVTPRSPFNLLPIATLTDYYLQLNEMVSEMLSKGNNIPEGQYEINNLLKSYFKATYSSTEEKSLAHLCAVNSFLQEPEPLTKQLHFLNLLLKAASFKEDKTYTGTCRKIFHSSLLYIVGNKQKNFEKLLEHVKTIEPFSMKIKHIDPKLIEYVEPLPNYLSVPKNFNHSQTEKTKLETLFPQPRLSRAWQFR